MPSSPDARDAISAPSERPAAWITEPERGVAFLDLPGLDADEVVAELERALVPMPGDSVVCVFTDDPASEERVTDWGARHDIEPIAVIAHEVSGWTLALRSVGTDVRPSSERPPPPP